MPPLPSIHPSAHAHSSSTDCTGLVTKSRQQQTSKRASESIAQETETTRSRDGRTDLQVAINPTPKKPHSLARSLAHLRLAASAHTIRSSRHHYHIFLARRADDECAIGPATHPHAPLPPSRIPTSHSALLCALLPSSSAARARVQATEQRRARPPPLNPLRRYPRPPSPPPQHARPHAPLPRARIR